MPGKLILLEGIPGSGKSTAGANLQNYLERKNVPSRFWRECCYLQNPLTVMLARDDAGPQVARRQIEKITEAIRELNPLVIYLHPQNVTAALQHVRAQRPQEWEVVDFISLYL